MSIWSLTYQQSVFKRYHSDKHFSEFLPTRWRQKSTRIDMEQHYVTVTLCIWHVSSRSGEAGCKLLRLLTCLLTLWDCCASVTTTRTLWRGRARAVWRSSTRCPTSTPCWCRSAAAVSSPASPSPSSRSHPTSKSTWADTHARSTQMRPIAIDVAWSVSVSVCSLVTKIAEPINVLFGVWTRVVPRNCVHVWRSGSPIGNGKGVFALFGGISCPL